MQPWQILLERIDSTPPSGVPELSAETQAELDAYNREETDDPAHEVVEVELVEEPDNVIALRPTDLSAAVTGPLGPPPAPLQTHAERYGDNPARNRRGSGPRVAGSRTRGPRDGR